MYVFFEVLSNDILDNFINIGFMTRNILAATLDLAYLFLKIHLVPSAYSFTLLLDTILSETFSE